MNKGFTLMELLAIVIVLGLIAVIAIPKVGDAVETSREQTATISMQNYLRALDDTIAAYNISSGEYTVDELDVIVSGKKPSSGTITIRNSEVTEAVLYYSNIGVRYTKLSGITIIDEQTRTE